MEKKDSKYNMTVAPLWVNDFAISSIPVDDEIFDKLQYIEKGSRIYIRFRSDKSRFNEQDKKYVKETLQGLKDFFTDRLGSRTSNHAYLEIMSKEEVERFAKKAKQRSSYNDDSVI